MTAERKNVNSHRRKDYSEVNKRRGRRALIDPSHYLDAPSHRTIYKSLIMQRLPNRQTVVSSATGWQWRIGGRAGGRTRGRANTAGSFVSAYLHRYFISISLTFLPLRLPNLSFLTTETAIKRDNNVETDMHVKINSWRFHFLNLELCTCEILCVLWKETVLEDWNTEL